MDRSVSNIRYLAAACWLCLAVLTAQAAQAMPEPAATPHRALYEIALVSKRSGSQVVDIKGKMYFEWDIGCDAWTTDHRFRITYHYADSAPLRIESTFSTYEPFDGQNFSFDSRRSRNGELFQELRGGASMNDASKGGGGTVDYTKPPHKAYTLAPGTYFPMAHTVAMIRHAMAGDKFFNAVLFDGSDDDGPVEINTFIGPPIRGLDAIRPGPHINKALLDVPAWKIRMAFFPTLQPATDPDYEMDAVLQQNGVISNMRIDYKEFSVTQTLVALEALPRGRCGAP